MCVSVIAVVLLTGRTLSIMLTDMVVSDRDTEVYAAQGNMAGTSAVPRLNNSSKNKTFT
jgi:hypothetical protein